MKKKRLLTDRLAGLLPTDEEKQQLMEALRSGPRRYEIHLTGYGGEIVLGTITGEQYQFWNNRNDLSDYVYDWSGQDNIPESMRFCQSDGWYNCDDLVHEVGAEFSSSCYITVYDEEGTEIWNSALDDESLEEHGVDTNGMRRQEFYAAHDSDAQYVFLGQSFEKGTFNTYEINTWGNFNPAKLSLSVIDVEGWELVDGISYESVQLDDTGGYSTTGKSAEYKVFHVER